MTFPAFDYGAMIAEGSAVWGDRGLHWHAYSWRGSGKEWANDAARDNHAAEITPTALRDWLKKPDRLIRATFSAPEGAAAWWLEQWMAARGDALTPVPGWITDEGELGLVLYGLRCGNDVSTGMWIRQGPSMMSWSVVGTPDRCH